MNEKKKDALLKSLSRAVVSGNGSFGHNIFIMGLVVGWFDDHDDDFYDFVGIIESKFASRDVTVLDVMERAFTDKKEREIVLPFNCCDAEYWMAHKDSKDVLQIVVNSSYATNYCRERAKKYLASHPGFVYLLGCEEGYYKIGCTKCVNDRIGALSTLPPFDFVLAHTIKADDMFKAEKELHSRYSCKRVRGEWFLLEKIDVEQIREILYYENGMFFMSNDDV